MTDGLSKLTHLHYLAELDAREQKAEVARLRTVLEGIRDFITASYRGFEPSDKEKLNRILEAVEKGLAGGEK